VAHALQALRARGKASLGLDLTIVSYCSDTASVALEATEVVLQLPQEGQCSRKRYSPISYLQDADHALSRDRKQRPPPSCHVQRHDASGLDRCRVHWLPGRPRLQLWGQRGPRHTPSRGQQEASEEVPAAAPTGVARKAADVVAAAGAASLIGGR